VSKNSQYQGAPDPIGGYFALEEAAVPNRLYESALGFQSARAAFSALLATGKPERVWVPRYICDAMLSPLQNAGIAACFYDLNESLGIASKIRLRSQEWLLYVNYFGICDAVEQEVLRQFDPAQVVLDHAQALLSTPGDCLATIYSPRKFLGVPDGGLLFTRLALPLPTQVDQGSVERCRHLLLRADGQLADGYAAFKQSEASLVDTAPRAMSTLSRRMTNNCDIHLMALRRRRNFDLLHSHFGALNRLVIPADVMAPLCYPLLLDYSIDKSRLADQGIFIPIYWQEVLGRCDARTVEHSLALNCLALPCDQRYGPEDIERLAQSVRAELIC
jgi:hypothetical protein